MPIHCAVLSLAPSLDGSNLLPGAPCVKTKSSHREAGFPRRITPHVYARPSGRLRTISCVKSAAVVISPEHTQENPMRRSQPPPPPPLRLQDGSQDDPDAP